MASEDQFLNANRGVGSRLGSTQLVSVAVNGSNTIIGAITVPGPSWMKTVYIETPVAIGGAPTNCYVRVGTTSGGQDIVADTDGKAQGHIAATIASTFDKVNGLNGLSQVYYQVNTIGGTSPSGTINLLISYDAPVH